MNKFFLLFITFISLESMSQNIDDIAKKASSMGINSEEKILEELRKRGMTIEDAKRMALIQGIDYDEYISKFIVNDDATTSLPVVSEIVIQSDTTQNTSFNIPIILEETDSLSYFGYDIFLNNPFANKDYLVGNIDEGYILAPGDVLRIYVFGDNTYQSEVTIDLNGNILLPEIGMFFASGYTFSSLKNRLTEFLGRSFSGLLDLPQRSFLDVSLTQLRPVKVTLLGESNAPGPHLVSGFATVLNALYSSGGIKKSGTLRNIKVFRNNKLKKTIDLYDYITNGSLDSDIRLMNNDIIFIPVRENTVTLTGSVRNKSIYELKEGEGINELLDYSGGLNANSSSLAIIDRIIPLKDRATDDTYSRYLTSFDISKSFTSTKEIYRVKKGDYLYRISKNYNVTVDEIKSWNKLSSDLLSIGQKLVIYNKDFDLLDGDVITFSEIPDKVLNSVTITGSVNRPGTFPLDKFPTLKILINEGANSILPRTYLGKVDVSKEIIDGSRSFVTYDLSKVLDGTLEVYLEDQDEIRVFSLEEVEGDDNIFLFGFGIEDTVSVPWKDNLNLYDFVFSNTPYNDKEFQSDFLRARVDVKRYNVETGSYYVIPLDIDTNKKFLLNKKDEIILYSRDVIDNINPKFNITGYVVNPGEYRLDSEMTVEDAVLSAGGLMDFADISRVAIYSLDTTSSIRSSSLNYFDLDMNYINGKSKKSKNSYIIRNFDNISLSKDPNIKDPVNVSVIGEVNSPGTVTLEFINESVESVINKVGGFTQNASLGGSYIVRDSLPIDFNFLKEIKKNKSFLTDNDIIIISNNKEEITVSGAVNNPSKLLFSKLKAKHYLKNSGGKSKKLASDAFVIYPSGRAKKIGFLKNPKIYPGSEIFVSFKEIEQNKESGRFFDRFTTIFSVITGALTTLVLAKQLSN